MKTTRIFIVMLLGLFFAASSNSQPTMINYQGKLTDAAGVGISLAIGFTYWLLISVFRAFGHSGILPALLSAWSPHLLFGGAGLLTLLSIRQ